MTYRIIDNGDAIKCLRCTVTSYNKNDVIHLYCSYCKRFHHRGHHGVIEVPMADDEETFVKSAVIMWRRARE